MDDRGRPPFRANHRSGTGRNSGRGGVGRIERNLFANAMPLWLDESFVIKALASRRAGGHIKTSQRGAPAMRQAPQGESWAGHPLRRRPRLRESPLRSGRAPCLCPHISRLKARFSCMAFLQRFLPWTKGG